MLTSENGHLMAIGQILYCSDIPTSYKSRLVYHLRGTVCLESCLAVSGRAGIGSRLFRSQMPNASFPYWAQEQVSDVDPSIEFSDLDCSSAPSDFSGFDSSRLPHVAYIKHEGALNAIRKELFGLVRNPHTTRWITAPALSIIGLRDEQYDKLPRYATTLFGRQKSTGVMQSMLCLSGDTISIDKSSFASAPTADRIFVRWLLSCDVQFGSQVGSCDITQEFLQSEWLQPHGRYLALVHPCIQLRSCHCDGAILASPPKMMLPVRFSLLFRKPLYGSRRFPLRWYFKIASVFKEWGWRCRRCDICVFSKRDSSGSLTSLAIIHVDDVFLAAFPAEITSFLQTMQVFRRSGFSYLKHDEPLVFRGMELAIRSKGKLGLTQDSYRQHVPRIQQCDFYGAHASYQTKERIRRIGRRVVGSLLWLVQSRFDID